MKARKSLYAVVVSALLAAACSSNPVEPDASGGGLDGADDDSAITTGVSIDDSLDGQAVDPQSVAGRAPEERVIYFDFDESDIRAEYLQVVSAHGRFLAQNPEGRVRLEGHTDERGTREYNIALGESRAKSIAGMLELQGVQPAQLRTVSYGEELPVDEGHDNAAWAKNRRVNIIYELDVPN